MIVAVPKKVLTVQQKNLLTKKGYVVIECDDPEKIRIINPENNMDTSDWFLSALAALRSSIPVGKSEVFIDNLYQRLIKKE